MSDTETEKSASPEDYSAASRENRARNYERAAERPELKLLARLNMAYVTPALLMGILALGALIWNDQREAIRDQGRAQRDQQSETQKLVLEMTAIRGQVTNVITFLIPALQSSFDSRFNAQTGRIDALVRSDESQNKDIRDLYIQQSGGKR